MVVNHDCLKSIISVFVTANEAEITIQDLVTAEAVQNYSVEELKFHLNRLSDERWIVSNRTTQPYEMIDPNKPTWSLVNWRISERASQYWDASNQITIWEEFKSKTASESLEFSLDLLKGYLKVWVETKLNQSEI